MEIASFPKPETRNPKPMPTEDQMNHKFHSIINRIEQVRKRRGLNKSRFVAAFGMMPQTYSNFIGSQGSKPSIELLTGVVRAYWVDPTWLLTGAYRGDSRSSEEYTRDGGAFCPACGSDEIEGSEVNVEGDGAWQPVSCQSCGASWNGLYRLTGYDGLKKEADGKTEAE